MFDLLPRKGLCGSQVLSFVFIESQVRQQIPQIGKQLFEIQELIWCKQEGTTRSATELSRNTQSRNPCPTYAYGCLCDVYFPRCLAAVSNILGARSYPGRAFLSERCSRGRKPTDNNCRCSRGIIFTRVGWLSPVRFIGRAGFTAVSLHCPVTARTG